MTETFLAEVGVLLLVFPVLDKFDKEGLHGLTRGYVAISLSGSLFFFAFASVLAVYNGEG